MYLNVIILVCFIIVIIVVVIERNITKQWDCWISRLTSAVIICWLRIWGNNPSWYRLGLSLVVLYGRRPNKWDFGGNYRFYWMDSLIIMIWSYYHTSFGDSIPICGWSHKWDRHHSLSIFFFFFPVIRFRRRRRRCISLWLLWLIVSPLVLTLGHFINISDLFAMRINLKLLFYHTGMQRVYCGFLNFFPGWGY